MGNTAENLRDKLHKFYNKYMLDVHRLLKFTGLKAPLLGSWAVTDRPMLLIFSHYTSVLTSLRFFPVD